MTNRPLNQSDLDVLDQPIGGSFYCEEPRSEWRRWCVALMLIAAVLGVIGLVANERAAEREEAKTEAMAREAGL